MLENIKIENKNGVMVVSSREIAENFGKRHTEVLRAIQNKLTDAKLRSLNYFIENEYIDNKGEVRKEYLMTRDGFSFLVMGFTGKKADRWKIKYIDAFNKMEETIKNGSQYKVPQTPMEALSLMFEVQKENAIKIDKLDERVTTFEENSTLSPSEYNVISNKIHERIRIIKSEYGLINATRRQNAELYKSINRDVKEMTGVYTRAQLRQKDFARVMELIRDWTPSKALMMKINQISFEF
ncbi:MAG: Rha family transcriptional regulator [Bacilli bacterium]|nr:Rha family transcriptional regulator [Bacilli bacterium]